MTSEMRIERDGEQFTIEIEGRVIRGRKGRAADVEDVRSLDPRITLSAKEEQIAVDILADEHNEISEFEYERACEERFDSMREGY